MYVHALAHLGHIIFLYCMFGHLLLCPALRIISEFHGFPNYWDRASAGNSRVGPVRLHRSGNKYICDYECPPGCRLLFSTAFMERQQWKHRSRACRLCLHTPDLGCRPRLKGVTRRHSEGGWVLAKYSHGTPFDGRANAEAS